MGTGGTNGSGGASGTGGVGGAPETGGTNGSGGSVGTGGATGAGGLGPPANNQIVNGDFNNGSSSPWSVTSGGGTPTGVTTAVTNGQFCVTVPSSMLFTIGWPANGSPVAVLQPSTTYELYYQISTTATFASFAAKVGSATSLNPTDFITGSGQGTPVAGAGLQTFAFTFVPGSDPGAGIAFNITAGYNAGNPSTVCIDNVYLGTPN